MIQKRIKSPVLWVSTLTLIAFVVKNWMGYEIPQFDEFIELLLAVLTAFGIVNNPTNADKF